MGQATGFRGIEQGIVRHARPQEVTQARRQLEGIDGLGALAGNTPFDPEQESGRHQHGLAGDPQGGFETGTAGAHRLEQRKVTVEFLGRWGAAEGAAEELLEVRPGGPGFGGVPHGFLADQVGPRCGRDQFVGRGEVPLHQHRRNEKGVGIVVEPAASAAVGWESVGRLQVHTEQVADGVVVFRAAEPVRDLRSGIPRDPRRIRVLEDAAEFIDEEMELLDGGLLLPLGRHRFLLDGAQCLLPETRVAMEALRRIEAREVDAPLLRLVVMAIETVLDEDRPHTVAEGIGREGSRRHEARRQRQSNQRCPSDGWTRRHQAMADDAAVGRIQGWGGHERHRPSSSSVFTIHATRFPMRVPAWGIPLRRGPRCGAPADDSPQRELWVGSRNADTKNPFRLPAQGGRGWWNRWVQ